MMNFRKLSPEEYPSLLRLVQLVLCDDEWARIDAFRMAYEHVYGIRLDEREAEGYVRQKAAIQQLLRSSPISHDLGAPSNFAVLDGPVDKRGVNNPLGEGFANLSLDGGDPVDHDPTPRAPASGVPGERPKMERAPTSTSGVSVVVPCKELSMSNMSQTTTKTRKDSLATLDSFTSVPRLGPPSSPRSRICPPNSDIGDRDRDYKHWGRLDDPDSVWNKLHVERPKLSERKRFSSYTEYKKTRNQPMKDNDRLFKKRLRQSFAREEVLAVDSDVGEDEDNDAEQSGRGGERVVGKAGPKRQILLVKRKGNLAGQNL